MPRSYSQDLRDRVIRAVTEEGFSRRASAARFGVSESSAIKWVRRFEQQGSKAPVGTGRHRPSKIKPHQDWVFGVMEAHKDITLEGLARMMADELNVQVDTGMLSRFSKSAGISFKKSVLPSEQERPDVARKRARRLRWSDQCRALLGLCRAGTRPNSRPKRHRDPR